MRRDPEGSLVAVRKDKVVAYLFSDVRGQEYGFAEKTGWLEALGVDPDLQGSAIGRRLIDQILQRFQQTGVILYAPWYPTSTPRWAPSWSTWVLRWSRSQCSAGPPP